MTKLTVSYTKTMPLRNQPFSSETCEASVDVELPEGMAHNHVRARIREHFKLVRGSVDEELRTRPQLQTPPRQGQVGSAGKTQKASLKQIQFLQDLADKQNLHPRNLNAKIQNRFGIPDVHALSKHQASQMIDELAGNSGKDKKTA